MPYITVRVDTDEVLGEIDDDDLIEEAKTRGLAIADDDDQLVDVPEKLREIALFLRDARVDVPQHLRDIFWDVGGVIV
jgi:hypothetical protein